MEEECSICYEPLASRLSVRTPCAHWMCFECTMKLRAPKSCPMCRAALAHHLPTQSGTIYLAPLDASSAIRTLLASIELGDRVEVEARLRSEVEARLRSEVEARRREEEGRRRREERGREATPQWGAGGWRGRWSARRRREQEGRRTEETESLQEGRREPTVHPEGETVVHLEGESVVHLEGELLGHPEGESVVHPVGELVVHPVGELVDPAQDTGAGVAPPPGLSRREEAEEAVRSTIANVFAVLRAR